MFMSIFEQKWLKRRMEYAPFRLELRKMQELCAPAEPIYLALADCVTNLARNQSSSMRCS
jgi:hypothetical protein